MKNIVSDKAEKISKWPFLSQLSLPCLACTCFFFYPCPLFRKARTDKDKSMSASVKKNNLIIQNFFCTGGHKFKELCIF